MKKILTLLGIGALATMSYGQGTIVVNSIAGAYSMYTNTAVGVNFGGTGTGGVSGKTFANTVANGNSTYYYQLLIQPYTGGGVVDNPNAANGWVSAQIPNLATNSGITAGGIAGSGGTAGSAVANWAAPTGASASGGGTEMYYMLVGWSATLGSSWTTVYDDIVNNSWGSNTGGAPVGWSTVGYGYSGGGPYLVPAPSVFGVTASEPGGFTSGFTLYATPVPEPSVIMLAGLGGLSLLLFRRRK